MTNTGSVYVVENTAHKKCRTCNGVHDYVTGISRDIRNCSTPVGFSKEKAEEIATAFDGKLAMPPDDTIIIMDDSARKLPRANPTVQLMISESTSPKSFVKGG